METIDPTSPQESYLCYCGETHELGEHDCSGYFIGWIEDDCGWESVQERDIALTVGRFEDAWHQWNRCAGLVGPEPDPEEFAARICLMPSSVSEAVRECEDAIDPNDLFARLRVANIAARANLN